MRTNTREVGSTLSPTCDFISKPSDFKEVTSHQRHPSSPRLSCALVPPQKDPGYLQPRETKPGHRGEPRGAHPLPRSRSPLGPGKKLTRNQPDSSRRGGNPRSPRTGISRALLSVRPSRRGSELQAAVAARTPPRGASPLSLLPRRSRPAPRLAAPTPAGQPGKLQRPLPPSQPGGWLAGAAPETPRRAES